MADPAFLLSGMLNIAVGAASFVTLWKLEPRVRGTFLWIPLCIPFLAIVAANAVEAGVAALAYGGDLLAAQLLARSRPICVLFGEAGLVHLLVLYPRQWPTVWGRPATVSAYGLAGVVAALGPSQAIFNEGHLVAGYPVPGYTPIFWIAQGLLLALLVACTIGLAQVYRHPRGPPERRAALGMAISVILPLGLYVGLGAANVPIESGQIVTVVLSLFLGGIAVAVLSGHLALPTHSTMERVLATSASPVFMVDRDGLLAFLNRAARESFEVGKAAQGKPFETALAGAFSSRSAFEEVASKIGDVILAKAPRHELAQVLVGPGRRPFRLMVDPLMAGGEGSPPVGCVVQFIDEGKRVEADRATARVRDLQDLVIRLIGHDIKTPITVMQGYIELAQAHIPGTLSASEAAVLRKDLLKAGEAAAAMNVLIANARAISRLTMDSLTPVSGEPVDLSQMVVQAASMLRPLAEAKRQTLEVDAQPGVRVLLAPGFDSVASNLLSNAIKYTPAGGKVGVRIYGDETHAALEVWDSGPGIPPEKRDRLFRKFDRLGAEAGADDGHGLGLSIVAKLVELSGGMVCVGDKEDGTAGAMFVVELPLARADGEPAPP